MKTSKIKLKNNSNSNNENILYCLENYNSEIINPIQEIITKIIDVILEYMKHISEKIVIKNKNYYKFVFQKGIETLIHIFTLIFFYTKNLELSYYHTQKAYYVYIEYIEQISDENITFLQLSSRDAILFVYKKTIFELNNEYIKTMKEPNTDEKLIFSLLTMYTNLYKNIIQFLITNNDFIYESNSKNISNSCDSIKCINETINVNKLKKNQIEIITLFINSLSDKKIDPSNYVNLIVSFIKNITNKKILDTNQIMNKIYKCDINYYIINNEFNFIIDFIFQ
jgi:hypothetical protein